MLLLIHFFNRGNQLFFEFIYIIDTIISYDIYNAIIKYTYLFLYIATTLETTSLINVEDPTQKKPSDELSTKSCNDIDDEDNIIAVDAVQPTASGSICVELHDDTHNKSADNDEDSNSDNEMDDRDVITAEGILQSTASGSICVKLHEDTYKSADNDEDDHSDNEIDDMDDITADDILQPTDDDIFQPTDDDIFQPTDNYDDNNSECSEYEDAMDDLEAYGMYDTSDDEINEENDRYGLHGHLMMFAAANLKVHDVMTMIRAFELRHGLTLTARQDLLQLIKILAGPAFEEWNVSNYNISKMYDPPADKIVYTFYCSSCNIILIEPIVSCDFTNCNAVCQRCKENYFLSTACSNYFTTIDMRYQLETLFKDKNIVDSLLNNVSQIRRNLCNDDDSISDIYDSQLYKKALGNADELTLTYNFNTDGAPIFHSSKKSFWPMFFLLNELPVDIRFKHIFLAGLWIGLKEPSPGFMQLFVNSFVKMAVNLLEEGLMVRTSNGISFKFTVKPMCMCVDSVARPVIRNQIQFNGYEGCNWCYIYGVYDGAVRYPMTFEEPALRSHDEHIVDAMRAEEKRKAVPKPKKPRDSMVRGTKGEMALLTLPFFDCVWGFPIDYMHGVILGVTSQLWTIWSSCCNGEFYLTKQKQADINNRMKCIQPPHEIHRLPRPISDSAKWKASEWRSWLLFYSYPCLLGLLDDTALNSFMLFSRSIHCLLQRHITPAMLLQCEVDLLTFVSECNMFYSVRAMTFNIHILLHIVESVKQSGPLWATSCFPFESANYLIKQQVNGPNGLYQQISKKLLQLRTFQGELTSNSTGSSEKAYSFCKEILQYRKVKHAHENNGSNAIFIGFEASLMDPELPNVRYFNRCIYSGAIYHSKLYTRPKKTNDTVVLMKNKKIVEITNFCCIGNENRISGNELIVKEITAGANMKISHIRQVVEIKSNVVDAMLTDIEMKMVCIDINKVKYVCFLPNAIEIQ